MMELLSAAVVFSVVVSVAANTVCPAGEVLHRHDNQTTVCCKPTFNCDKDTEYKVCSRSGGQDTCEPCDEGSENNKQTSFHNRNYACFKPTSKHAKCTLMSTIAVASPVVKNCALHCECNVAGCFYGNPCEMCYERMKPCGENEELNVTNGACQPCPDLMYSSANSCGPCLWNETAWRLKHMEHLLPGISVSQPVSLASTSDTDLANDSNADPGYNTITDEPFVTTQKQEEEKKKKEELSIAVVIVILVIIVACGVLGAIVLYTYRKIRAKDTNSRLVVMYYKLCPNKAPAASPTNPEDPAPEARPTLPVAPMIRSSETEDTPFMDSSDVGVGAIGVAMESSESVQDTGVMEENNRHENTEQKRVDES